MIFGGFVLPLDTQGNRAAEVLKAGFVRNEKKCKDSEGLVHQIVTPIIYRRSTAVFVFA
jgi:hypothetical protein